MADQLYLSLWFPNFRLESLPQALVGVMRQFAIIAGDKRVAAASAYPIDFTESPTYQRIYVNDERAAESPDTAASAIELAVAEATEQLHEDMAYEFEMTWHLWYPEGSSPSNPPRPSDDDEDPDDEDLEDSFDDVAPRKTPIPFPGQPGSPALDSLWKRHPATVRILGFGPEFDQSGYAQNGHIRVDFGLDTPWTLEDASVDEAATKHIQQNVEMLLAFTLLVEKQCSISSRLLWTESGEPLAEKLIARLQKVH
ncbi:hypothetical protein [Granulicella sibirica]|uniref:Uncharacterized protein n=1 Tax=Granulicella sibirica TaxID=2479048 RepID=A0A4Q0T095_9BACT|nr:hypothetical protein [Granulicella sibirica]RXH57003.1 hypothetical protein GRAN_0313 [Granulicella sibirica]